MCVCVCVCVCVCDYGDNNYTGMGVGVCSSKSLMCADFVHKSEYLKNPLVLTGHEFDMGFAMCPYEPSKVFCK